MNPSHAHDIYPDLLGPESDAALTRLVGDLADFYVSADAPTGLKKSLDASPLQAVGARPRLISTRVGRPRIAFRAAALIAAAAVMLIVGVVGYAVAPLVDKLLGTERGADTLPMQNIGQAQTSNGVTVKVERAYADVNRVLVAYTIQVPAGFANSTSGIDGKISLTDARGLTFPRIDGQGLDGNAPHVGAGLVSFDAESLAPGTTGVALRLTFPDVRAKADKPGGRDLTAGAFAFMFNVPVAPGRVVSASKTVIASGVSVTLERVVIAPSETRAYLRFPATAGISDTNWYAQAHISGASWDSRQLPTNLSGLMTLGAFFTNSDGEHVTTWSGDFSGRHGIWTVTVERLAGADSAGPATEGGLPKQARVEGPWTFMFSLP